MEFTTIKHPRGTGRGGQRFFAHEVVFGGNHNACAPGHADGICHAQHAWSLSADGGFEARKILLSTEPQSESFHQVEAATSLTDEEQRRLRSGEDIRRRAGPMVPYHVHKGNREWAEAATCKPSPEVRAHVIGLARKAHELTLRADGDRGADLRAQMAEFDAKYPLDESDEPAPIAKLAKPTRGAK